MENAENKPNKSKRDLALERMRGRYPDKSFDDDEALFGQINDDYDDYDKRIGDYKTHEKQLTDMYTSDPRSAAFLTEWSKGGDPAIMLVRMFGTDIKDAIDDPERQEEMAAANKEYVERVAKEKELDEEYQNNLAASLQYLDDLQAKNGLDDDEVDGAMALLINIVRDGIMGKFSPESIDLAMKAINHDNDVSLASEEGEVRGRNAKIEEKLRRSKRSDGTANLAGKNNAGGRGNRAQSIFDLANMAK